MAIRAPDGANKCLSILNSIGFHSTSCRKGEKLSLFESIYFTNFCFFKQWLHLGRFWKVLNSTPKLHYHFLVHRLVITRNRYTELCYLEGRRPLLPAAKLQIHTPEWCDDHVVSNKYRCSIVISWSRTVLLFCSQIWLKRKKSQVFSKCISNSKGSSAVVKIQRLTDN